jgi:hypothetical protein
VSAGTKLPHACTCVHWRGRYGGSVPSATVSRRAHVCPTTTVRRERGTAAAAALTPAAATARVSTTTTTTAVSRRWHTPAGAAELRGSSVNSWHSEDRLLRREGPAWGPILPSMRQARKMNAAQSYCHNVERAVRSTLAQERCERCCEADRRVGWKNGGTLRESPIWVSLRQF